MSKRKIIYDDDDDSAVDENADVVSKKTRKRPAKQVGTDEAHSGSTTAARRSQCSSKGTGGRLVYMQELERIQTERLNRPSRMDLATQGEDVNPMAPSFQDTTGARPHSLSSPREADSAPPESRELSPPSFTPPRPVFTRAAPGQGFGFKLPQSVPQIRAPPRERFSAAKSVTSLETSASPGSLFSGRSASGATTAPTSRASSVCSSSGRRTYSQVVQQKYPPPQPERPFPPPSSYHRLSKSAIDRFSRSPYSGEPGDRSDRRSTARLERTASFYHLPLSMNRDGHTLSAGLCVEDQIEIDEVSPSEDERTAEWLLHERHTGEDYGECDLDINDSAAQNGLGTTFGGKALDSRPSSADRHRVQSRPISRNPDVEDVVAAHRERNRAPRLPTNAQLSAANRQQASSSNNSGRSIGVAPPADDDTPPDTPPSLDSVSDHRRQDSSGSRVDKPRSRNSRIAAPARASEGSAPPSQNTTPAPQHSAENAAAPQVSAPNQSVRRATEGSEPWQLQYYDPSTRDIIERAKQFSHCDAASINAFPLRPNFNVKAVEYIDEAIAERRSRGLVISDGWWPQHTSGIARLLWEDLGNWRSALRKKARTWVAQRYQWDPENRRERNVEIARELLSGGGLFLRDGSDDEGHVNNLAHPALSGLIMDFFYSGPTSVGKLFPEVFEKEVPRVVVALAATALKVVLDEVISGQSEVSFKVNVYSRLYNEILGLMDKCDSNDLYRAKTRGLRESWAHQGSGGPAAQPSAVGGGFDVDLG